MRVIQRLVSVRLNPVHLTWIAALFFATVGNMALWQTLWTHVEINSLRSALFFISLPMFLFCAFNVLLTPVLALPYLRNRCWRFWCWSARPVRTSCCITAC